MYKAPNKIAVKTTKGPVSVEAEYTLEAVGEGKTKLTVSGEADVADVFDLVEPIIERIARRQWDASLENLKDLLES